MLDLTLACPQCRVRFDEAFFNRPDFTSCPGCGAPIKAEVFPAFFQPPAVGQSGENILVEGESSCFYHPQKKAVIPCESCGRFLCALCDVEMKGQHLCPACVETGKKKGKLKHLQDQRVLYDDIALWLTILPMVFFPFLAFTALTAPMALYVSIRHWNAPTSLIPRTKLRFVIATVLASLQILGWAAVIIAFTRR